MVEQKAVPQVAKPPTQEPDDDVPDDVEIIEDEEIEEEAEEDEEDEEEISDVDDEELLTRLEAKYGRLPEPERPQRRSKHNIVFVFAHLLYAFANGMKHLLIA